MSQPLLPPERTMAEVLRRRAADTPNRLVFGFLLLDGSEGARLTYKDLDAQARSIAARLRGVAGEGNRALLLYEPGLDFIPAFFGCLYAGIIAVPAYPPRRGRDNQGLSRLVDDCQPRVVLTGGTAAGEIAQTGRDLEALAALHWLNTSLLPPVSSAVWSRSAEDPQAVSHLQYTSGSTGDPKGVIVSHGNVMHNEALIEKAFCHIGHGDMCGVTWLPFQHDMGLVGNVLQAVFADGPLWVLSPMTLLQRPAQWLEAISRYRAHTSVGPNFAYDLCVRRLEPEQRAALDLRCWEFAGLGAEPIRAQTIDAFADAFAMSGFRREAFYPSYGLAEATLMVAGGQRDQAPVVASVSAAALQRSEAVVVTADKTDPQQTRTLVGCGHTWLDQRIAIVDPQTPRLCPDGTVGEIWVSGPSVAQGYWNRPEETQAIFRARPCGSEEEFLRTGDLGFFHDGELFITGRLKDVLIVRGQNHYPQDIELTVQALDPAFRAEGTAVFQSERDGIERLVVLQEITRPGSQFDQQSLTRCIRQTVAERHGIEVDEVVFVRNAALPRTTSGKAQRHACRAAYESGSLPLFTAPVRDRVT